MYQIPDSTMELVADLYSFMDDEAKAAWSVKEAEKMAADQYRYEISEGLTPPYYSARDFYEVIKEFIRQDEEDA
jgi:hypothetical protein